MAGIVNVVAVNSATTQQTSRLGKRARARVDRC